MIFFPILPLPKEIIQNEKMTLYSFASSPLPSFFTFQLLLGKQDGQSGIWTYSFEQGAARHGQQGVEEFPGEKAKSWIHSRGRSSQVKSVHCFEYLH